MNVLTSSLNKRNEDYYVPTVASNSTVNCLGGLSVDEQQNELNDHPRLMAFKKVSILMGRTKNVIGCSMINGAPYSKYKIKTFAQPYSL